jgi:hypothetical protein
MLNTKLCTIAHKDTPAAQALLEFYPHAAMHDDKNYLFVAAIDGDADIIIDHKTPLEQVAGALVAKQVIHAPRHVLLKLFATPFYQLFCAKYAIEQVDENGEHYANNEELARFASDYAKVFGQDLPDGITPAHARDQVYALFAQ